MSRENRIEKIKEIENKHGTRVITYITGDRRGFETRIHPEVQNIFYEHLAVIGNQKKIDLYLYTTGGVIMAAWGLVNLIREFCDELAVIIPFKALSTGTLIALGADEIIMGKLGQLGPVDPSITTPYNPSAPGMPGQVLPVSVEEVSGYFELAKDKGITNLRKESELSTIFKQLSDKVHPLALGNVYRAKEQIKVLSKKLLSFHMDGTKESKKIDNIIKLITRYLYSHDYVIGRREAKKEIGLKIRDPEEISTDFEKTIYDLFKIYQDSMELSNPFIPQIFMGNNETKIGVFKRAFIESSVRTDVFITEKEFKKVVRQRPDIPVPETHFLEKIIKEGWEIETS